MENQRERLVISVDQYIEYRREGYLIVRNLLSEEETNRLQQWADDIYSGKITKLDILSPMPKWMEGQDKSERLASARIHMPHVLDETAEWALMHPKVLDVLEALIGPDVAGLQSMLFFNPPGKGGQGWHQDSFYIQTQPDSLIGVWIALDRADQDNGCLWVAPGSHHEPIYPPPKIRETYMHAHTRQIKGLFSAENASHMDDDINQLSEVAAKYGQAVPVVLEPGDVLFFHSHLLHRSYRNETSDRYRRAYVCHYCNAHSWVPWKHHIPDEAGVAENKHLLVRGRTDQPHIKPRFGHPVELTRRSDQGAISVAMPGGDMGTMEM